MLDSISKNIYPADPIEVSKDSTLESVFNKFWEDKVRNGYQDLMQYNAVLKKLKNKYRKISLFPIMTPDVEITNVIQMEIVGKQIYEVTKILENYNVSFEFLDFDSWAIFKLNSIKF